MQSPQCGGFASDRRFGRGSESIVAGEVPSVKSARLRVGAGGRETVAGKERAAASRAKRDRSKVMNRKFSGEVRFVVEKHGTSVAGSYRRRTLNGWLRWMRDGWRETRFWSGLGGRFVIRRRRRSRRLWLKRLPKRGARRDARWRVSPGDERFGSSRMSSSWRCSGGVEPPSKSSG